MAPGDTESSCTEIDRDSGSPTNVASSITSSDPQAGSLNSFGGWSSNNGPVTETSISEDILTTGVPEADEMDALTSQAVQHQDPCPSDVQNETWFRLVDVGSEFTEAHLADFRLQRAPEYLALSCLGSEDTIKARTTYLNLPSRYQRFPEQDLPHNFKEALSVTRTVALRYLWIDAICVNQDSDDEKRRQVMIMDTIYRQASATMISRQLWTSNKWWWQRLWVFQEFNFSTRKLDPASYDADQCTPNVVARSPLLRWLCDRNETWSTWGPTLLMKSQSRLTNSVAYGSHHRPVVQPSPQYSWISPLLKNLSAPAEIRHEILRTEASLQALQPSQKIPHQLWNQHLNDLRECHRNNTVSLRTLARHVTLLYGPASLFSLLSPSEINNGLRVLRNAQHTSPSASFTVAEALPILESLSHSGSLPAPSQMSSIMERHYEKLTRNWSSYAQSTNGFESSKSAGIRGRIDLGAPEDTGQGATKRASGDGAQLTSNKRPRSTNGIGQKSSKKPRRRKGDTPPGKDGQPMSPSTPPNARKKEYRCPYYAAASGHYEVSTQCVTANAPKVWKLVEYHMQTYHEWDATRPLPPNRDDNQDDKWYRLFLREIPWWNPNEALPGPYLQECNNMYRDRKYVRDYWNTEQWLARAQQHAIAIAALAAPLHVDEAIDPNLEATQPDNLGQSSISPSQPDAEPAQEAQRPSFSAPAASSNVFSPAASNGHEHTQEEVATAATYNPPTTPNLPTFAYTFQDPAPSMSSSAPNSPRVLQSSSPSTRQGLSQSQSTTIEESATQATSVETSNGHESPEALTLCNRKDALDEGDPHFACRNQVRCDCCNQIRFETDDGKRRYEYASERNIEVRLRCKLVPRMLA